MKRKKRRARERRRRAHAEAKTATNTVPAPATVFVTVDNGRNIAELVRAADPDTGVPVAHSVNRTQRAYDRLHHDCPNIVDRVKWQAADQLHELWLRARAVPDASSVDLDFSEGAYTEREVDPVAENELRRLSRALGVIPWSLLQALILDDLDPRTWRHRWHGDLVQATSTALGSLAREMNLA